jgi:hypothetical protein
MMSEAAGQPEPHARSRVPVQMWPGRAQSRCRCGPAEPSPDADVAQAEKSSPGADVARAEKPSPGADVARAEKPSPGADVARAEKPSPGADVAAVSPSGSLSHAASGSACTASRQASGQASECQTTQVPRTAAYNAYRYVVTGPTAAKRTLT